MKHFQICTYCVDDAEIFKVCQNLGMDADCPDCSIKQYMDKDYVGRMENPQKKSKSKPKPRKTKSKSKPKTKQPKDDVAMSSRLKAFLKQNGKK